GDNNGPASIQILDSTGSGMPCTWSSDNGQPAGSSSSCTIDISNQKYNAAWLNIDIPLPDDYTCNLASTTGCWWKVHIETTSGAAHDRTTWTARVSGDPVRWVE
ncbi:MAG TPA: hypothetical protein VLS86_05075, partial [Acidimicrobiia bacterium]|nr:hypothetical protein [Acidimicrobiia bacterium]